MFNRLVAPRMVTAESALPGRGSTPFVVPDTPYRVLVRGRDFTGLPFQRVHGPLHRPPPR